MAQFNRDVRLTIDTPEGSVDITELRIAFFIKKTNSWGANTAQVNIWNLNPDKRSKLRAFGDGLTLYAGYKDSAGTGLLFIGRTTQMSHQFEQPEIITSIDCGDGERNLNSIQISVSFDPGTSVKKVIYEVARKMGLTITQYPNVNDSDFPNGWSYAGMGSEALAIACARLNVVFSVQNENLVILAVNEVAKKPPHEINLNTGMIGIPQQYTYRSKYLPGAARLIGWRVRSLLRPEILPGDEVILRSEKVNFNLDGNFKVISIIHSGDTHGNPWDSTIELIPVVT